MAGAPKPKAALMRAGSTRLLGGIFRSFSFSAATTFSYSSMMRAHLRGRGGREGRTKEGGRKGRTKEGGRKGRMEVLIASIGANNLIPMQKHFA